MMSTIKERILMKEAQKIARKIETACENGSLFDLFEGSHVGTFGSNKLEYVNVIFGDCPWTELQFDVRENNAWIYIGSTRARVPQRAIYELKNFFSNLHYC